MGLADLSSLSSPPRRVVLCDVSLRDGLQSLSVVVPTATKLKWLDALFEAGLRDAEVGSFVPAKLMPQLADTEAVLQHAQKNLPGLHASVLVPNLKGALRALELGAFSLLVPLSASAAHSQANLRKAPDEVLREIQAIVEARNAAGSACRVDIGLSTAFGCTLQGAVPAAEVLRLLRAVRDIGVDAVGLADTVGFADPAQVQALFAAGRQAVGDLLHVAHFHDTRGLGSANAFAAWQAGATRFDASLGGIGGCPHAPGASGNVALEDLAFLFDRMGVATGVHTAALLALRQPLAQWLQGAPLNGALWRGGLHRSLPAVERAA